MLAGIEEAIHARKLLEVSGEKSAIETLLAGLIDYAGLYPPASLGMCLAVENYRRYRQSKHAHALGRFIVDFKRIDELLTAAGNARDLRLSVIVSQPEDRDCLTKLLEQGVPIEAVEMKAGSRADVERISRSLPEGVETYFEVSVEPILPDVLCAISATGGRAKLRMGGVVPEAIPSNAVVAHALVAFARAGVAFKATAGLHHPLRSRHRLTYSPESPTGLMHGFVNLACAAELIHSGGDAGEAEELLNEQDPESWTLTAEAIAWRSHRWTVDRWSETREKFVSFGSCSFEEPIRDLEALGWL
jgi:hypothetical protein